MLRCIVIDDEPLAIQLLTDYINKTEDLTCVNGFSDPIKAMQYITEESVDLVFLDIQMPELTGIQFMKIMQGKTNFILTTAYDQYAVEGFEYDVIDFLLKPITFDRFLISTNKAKERLQAKSTTTPTTNTSDGESKGYIFVKSEYKTQKLNLIDIQYLESKGDYVLIHYGNKKLMCLETMKAFEQKLPSADFMRVHRSYIIALNHIDFIERNRIKIGEQLIPISNSHQKEFWERVGGNKS